MFNRSRNHIPSEVVCEIISSLSSPELATVGLVNREFQAEADRLLYRSIGSMYLKKLIPCLDTVAAVKSKAVLVKSLAIHSDAHRDEPWTTTMTSAIVDRLCTSLPNMTSLEHLQLRIYPEISKERDLIRALEYATPLQHRP
jgi:hypothetical protein